MNNTNRPKKVGLVIKKDINYY